MYCYSCYNLLSQLSITRVNRGYPEMLMSGSPKADNWRRAGLNSALRHMPTIELQLVNKLTGILHILCLLERVLVTAVMFSFPGMRRCQMSTSRITHKPPHFKNEKKGGYGFRIFFLCLLSSDFIRQMKQIKRKHTEKTASVNDQDSSSMFQIVGVTTGRSGK